MKRFLLIALALVVLTGCSTTPATEGKVLVNDASVKITTQGHTIAVYDKGSGAVYNFRPVLKRRSESATAPRTAVKTSTITIDTLPGGGLVVSTKQNTYEIRRKLWINL